MNTLKSIFIILGAAILLLLLLVYVFIYRNQERFLFFPEKLPADYTFTFSQPFEEVFVPAADGTRLHGLLFKTGAPRGLVFYLHGNGGSVRSWGELAPLYNGLGYDLFMFDYRGYGKSEGTIRGEARFYDDIQVVYDAVMSRYPALPRVILGYSIGTGPAAWLASRNPCDLLVLEAPYYSLADLKDQWYPLVPDLVLKYRFETGRFLQQVDAPVVLFHGVNDEVISFRQATSLKAHLKQHDLFVPLNGQQHNGISMHPQYRPALEQALQALPH